MTLLDHILGHKCADCLSRTKGMKHQLPNGHWICHACGEKREVEKRRLHEEERLRNEIAERKAKDDAARKAKEQEERKAKENAAREAKEEEERRAKAAAAQKAIDEAQRKVKEEAERKAKVEATLKSQEDAVRRAKEAAAQRLEPNPSAKRNLNSLQLPIEFEGDRSYRNMFEVESHQRLHSMCQEMPIEALNLENPGSSRAMGSAITQVFALSGYMATKAVPPEFGDAMFPRLVAKITSYRGSDLHLDLCDLVRDFAIDLASSGRNSDAVKVMQTLRTSPFWSTWSDGNFYLFASLNNIAHATKRRSDFEAALKASNDLSNSQRQRVEPIIAKLQRDMPSIQLS